jgi:hypothetical protein
MGWYPNGAHGLTARPKDRILPKNPVKTQKNWGFAKKWPVAGPTTSVVEALRPVVRPTTSVAGPFRQVFRQNTQVVRATTWVVEPSTEVVGLNTWVVWQSTSVVGASGRGAS